MSKKPKDKPEIDKMTDAAPAADTADNGDTSEKSADGKTKPLGTAKAVETMFRNAVRSEMDLIALAATKANIMISLNGLIISALMISGAFLFASSMIFTIPAGIFMFTAAVSIIFALLSASPENAHYLNNLRSWFAAWREGRASWRELIQYMRMGEREKDSGINLLIYEDRVLLSRDDYWDQMQTLLRDRDDIYHQMSDQLYWLGQMSARKFQLLNVSYTVFRWGLTAAVVAFIAIKLAYSAFPALSDPNRPRLTNLGISEFTDIYEPSAVQQLPDGRVLVVEDEADRAMSILRIGPDGRLIEDAAGDVRLTRSFGRRLNDLEGLSVDDRGLIYAITSHSNNAAGERRADREQLLRFRIQGNSAGEIRTVNTLRDALAGSAMLRESLSADAGEEIDFSDLNIEGLAFYPAAQQLLLGLRDPKVQDRSVIIPITNPTAMFERDAPPEFARPILLDLAGGGIRALSYDAVLGAFLIVNEIRDEGGRKISQLWSWSGEISSPPEMLVLPDMINLNNVESVDSISINGESRLLLMSDDGDPDKNIPAKYLMIDYAQIGRS
ncbi:MAG: DUF5706 domain-containing protein [Paracoccus sp. (in: a-proteobacteria)]|nr:DUF5706 domain-containing protein [Paracoccus sp. (in: a-proteobacteria)]